MRFGVSRRTAPGRPDHAEPDSDLEAEAEATRGWGEDDRGPEPPAEPDDPGELQLTQPPPVVVPRWVQLVLLPLSLVALWALARAAGNVLLILIVASVIALILAPIVRELSQHMPRGIAIALVYLAGFGLVAGLVVALANPVANQVTHFEHNLPSLIRHANSDLTGFQQWLNNHGINIHIQRQGQSALDTLQKALVKRSGAIVSFSRDLLSTVVTVSFDLVLILVLSVYLLIYGREIGDLARRIMPPGDGTPEDDYPRLVQRAVTGYVRGQLLFSVVMGASAALALTIFGVVGIFPDGERYAVFFGAFYGLMEFIPYIGPIIGPLPAVLVALFQDPLTALWVVLLFVGLQQLEGHVVAPQVFRISLRVNPILIILGLLIGYQLYGIVGALVALPVIAVIRQTVVYLRRHLVFEPWGTAVPGALAGLGLGLGGSSPGPSPPGPSPPEPSPPEPSPPAVPPDHERCPDCGEAAGADDAYCRSCGASLAPRVRSSG